MENFTSCVTGDFKKFYADGTVKTFSGNTFICHIPKMSNFWRFASFSQAKVGLVDFYNKMVMLPPDSFHMTVFEGVCEEVRKENNWVKSFPLDTPLYKMTSYFFNKISKLYKPEGLKMRAKKIVADKNYEGVQFILEPLNKEEENKILKFRSIFKDVTGMVNHHENGYKFHCALSYIYINLTYKEKDILEKVFKDINKALTKKYSLIELGPIEYCYFENMFRFSTLAVLE